jgi:hypothetical protein
MKKGKPQTLNEELNRMKKLISFSVGDHSHDVLSEENINESVPFLWTEKNALLFAESILQDKTLLKESSDIDDSFIDEIIKNVDEGEEEAFFAYMVDYFEKLLGEKLDTDFLIDDSDEDGTELNERRRYKKKFKYTDFGKAIRGFFRKLFQKSTYKKLKKKIGAGFKKVFGRDGLGGFLKKTFKGLGKKFKGLGKKTKSAFKNLGKKIRRLGKKGITINIYKPGATEEMSSSKEYAVNTPEDEWDEMINNSRSSKLMVKKMDSYSKEQWEILKKDEENKSFAVAAVEFFKRSNKKTKWKQITVGKDIEKVSEVIPNPDYEEKEPTKDPVEPIAFPLNGNPSQLFADNCTGVGDEVKKQMSLLKEKLTSMMDEMEVPEGESKIKIDGLSFVASSSRFRNGKSSGCDASNLTWKQLSEKRLENLKNYIIDELSSIGVTINDFPGVYNESLNSDGSNGDGSSGPNPGYVHKSDPAYKNAKIKEKVDAGEKVGYTISKDGKYSSIDSSGSRENAHKTKSEYEKYKYVKGAIYLRFNEGGVEGGGELPDDENLEVITIETDTTNYPITFYKPPKSFYKNIKLKFPKIKWPSPGWLPNIPPLGGGGGADGCEWKN